ncbi:type II toxin-antitoxin system Phd/YefM family antitoxin [Rhodoplanes sp. TEM]|uniref:Antitoxin n=1 Tax=Rhodoplanes tepidamans TaxID=200616 RepID=A0ABT5JJE5_RHOTP|nr:MULTISPECIES: type II toxin-antitoxin system Phd/YefM family antitoxin [Rhodoplanes]MDC7789856.1 type II toxin-antitoxin system Phd/YefM family antitoxin [Rhodoplanes tepidamans]MDC7987643.1 type II toxin-antitoxin system Phd/YefM family antitoxin [Rhodoplanes sp. TEM]MDQ0358507.1 prevent-host-death family protein [Rhodoplanes tepidamans]
MRTTMTSREFNQNTSKAKKAAERGPVFITDRGRPALVLLSIDDYDRLLGRTERVMSLAEALAQSGDDAGFDFDPPKLQGFMKPVDFD